MKKENITTFAPVSIPTLCRYEHFKRCIESLSRCTWAEYTDVYVALDYPAKESHWEGYRKIKAYLDSCGSITFKSLNVIVREKNYGFGPNGNHASLIKELWKKYDRRIGTEDDNEFSPNFLVYMNKALERFKNDDRVFCVCGYSRRMDLPKDCVYNYYMANDYVAWGVGYWKSKTVPEKYGSLDYLKQILQDKETYQLLRVRSPHSIRNIVSTLKSKSRNPASDMLINIFEALENKYSLMPALSQVRNHGNDGSGAHSLKKLDDFNNYFANQPIDEATDYEFQNEPFVLETDVNIPSYLPKWKKSVKETIFKIDLFLVRRFGIVLHTKYI